MAKRRSAIQLSRGQTDQMTDALFASKLYDQLEGIESHFGTKGSLRQGFQLLSGGDGISTNISHSEDKFQPVNLIFSIGRPLGGHKTKLFYGGGRYYDRRVKGNKDLAYISSQNMPGFEMTDGSIIALQTPYKQNEIQDYLTMRHEMGHHIHAELKRFNDLINEPATGHMGAMPDYYHRAKSISSNLSIYNTYMSALPTNFVSGQHRLIADRLMYSNIRKSLNSSVLSSSERKRGELFASMLEHASLTHQRYPSSYEKVRILGDKLRPDMFGDESLYTLHGQRGIIAPDEDLGRFLVGTFSRHKSNRLGVRSPRHD
jgi:hypothetical protein